jgi:hypothetical protein
MDGVEACEVDDAILMKMQRPAGSRLAPPPPPTARRQDLRPPGGSSAPLAPAGPDQGSRSPVREEATRRHCLSLPLPSLSPHKPGSQKGVGAFPISQLLAYLPHPPSC